jgi:hypothetical protein
MIYVFKTTVRTKKQILKLKPHIDKLLPNSIWNFDLEDCDNILRIDTNENIATTIINLLKIHTFDCEELE